MYEDCLGRVGGDLLQCPCAQAVVSAEAPRKHDDAVFLDERRRVDGRLQQRLARRCVDRLLAIREEQHDLSRAHAAIIGEELPRGFETGGDRGLAVCRHLVDSRVDHGRVVRPWHARRRIRREGHFTLRPRTCSVSSSRSHRAPERSQPVSRREAWARAEAATAAATQLTQLLTAELNLLKLSQNGCQDRCQLLFALYRLASLTLHRLDLQATLSNRCVFSSGKYDKRPRGGASKPSPSGSVLTTAIVWPSASTNHPEPLAALTPPVEPTLAPSPSRPFLR